VIELLQDPETRPIVITAVQEQVSQVASFVQQQDDKQDRGKDGGKPDIQVTDTRCQP
jgi:hypothetical protein